MAHALLRDEAYFQRDLMRQASLEDLVGDLKRFSEDTAQDGFSALFARAQLVLELDDLALARLFKVSRPTIGRWARGESAPHPIGREAVFESLIEVAKAKLKHYAKALVAA